jgi:ABC-type multidrug transport system fused ATPase/permease subunit
MKFELVKTLQSIWRVLPRFAKRWAALLVALMAAATLLEALGIGMIIPFIGALIPNSGVGQIASTGIVRKGLLLITGYPLQKIVLLLLFLFILKNAFLAGLASFQTKFIFRLESELSKGLLLNYLNRHYSYFANQNSAQLIRNVVGEVSNFCHNAVQPLLGLLSELLIAGGVLTLLVIVNPVGALFMAVALGLLGTAFHRQLRHKVALWGEERQFHEGMRLQRLQESFGAIKEIKIAGLQDQFYREYARHTDGSCASGRRQQTVQSLPRLLLEVLAVVGLVLAVLMIPENQRTAIVPILGLYAAAAFRLMPSANRILNSLQALRFAQSSIELIARECVSIEPIVDPVSNDSLPFTRWISMKGVSFSYADGALPVFESVNLEIAKGEIVCVVGPSGAGKSTLIDLLCGLLIPTSGQLLVDDRPINRIEDLWHKHIAYVPQTIFLVDGSIKENITLGVAQSDNDEMRLAEVIKLCGLREFVDSLEEGLNTSVGERGAKLSGGQRQRIGLAREIYRARDVLVLDEATNALDANTEAELVANIGQSDWGMTVIWITHGESPLKFADKLIVVEAGAVIVTTLEPKGSQ